tara:strand:+ start:1692 stop:3065 length:1374 start_codon:yes stop_codon:yes gene_type:complete
VDISNFLDAVKANDKENVELFLSQTQWKAGKTYKCDNAGHDEFTTPTALHLHDIASRCGNADLTYFAIVNDSVFLEHSPLALTSLIKNNLTCKKSWNLFIKKYKSNFLSSSDMNVKLIKHALSNRLDFIFKTLTEELGLIDLSFSRFTDNEITMLKSLFDKGVIGAELFYGDICDIASDWVDHKVNPKMKISSERELFYENILKLYMGDEPNLHNVTKLTSEYKLTYFTIIELLKIKAIDNCNLSFKDDFSSFDGLSDGEINFLVDYITIQMSDITMTSLISASENQNTVDKLLHNQIKVGNVKAIQSSLKRLLSRFDSNLTMVVSFIGRNIKQYPYLAATLNFNWYYNFSLKTGFLKEIGNVDWKVASEFFYDTPQPMLENPEISLKDKIKAIIKDYPSVKPAMLAYLINKHSLEQVCSVLSNMDEYTTLLLIYSPMEVMSLLPARGQKYILSNIT